ncbi:MAG: hypothetical protein AAGA27_03975 [Pseudomonadota bacterium]
MRKLNQHIQKYLYCYAVISSIVLLLIRLAYNQPFNPDGILYLHAAQAYQQQGLHAAMHVYPWPFMSIVIAWIASITHLSLLHAAYIFNLITDTITTIALLLFAAALGLNRAMQTLLLLLLIIFPYFAHYRFEVLRGHGYYAFALLAMLCLVHYANHTKWRHAIGFFISAVLATLFRIEGAAFIYLAPIALLFCHSTRPVNKIKTLIKCYSLPIVLVLLLVIYHSTYHQQSLGRVQNISNLFTNTLPQLFDRFLIARQIIADIILIYHSHRTATILLLTGIPVMVIDAIVTSFGIVYTLLLLYTLFRAKKFPKQRNGMAVLITFILINILVVLFFSFRDFFLENRYVALLNFLLLLLLPLGIKHIYQQAKHRNHIRQRLLFVITIVLLLYNAVGAIAFIGPSKSYLIKGGQWIAQNIPSNKTVYISNSQLAYYAKRKPSSDDNLNMDTFPQTDYDYVTLIVSHHHQDEIAKFIAQTGNQPVVTFTNNRNDKLLIFKIKPSKHSGP